MTNETATKNGFQMMMAQRSAMNSWTHVRSILNHGSNREAAAIVESFERQIQFEESQSRLSQIAA
ncbi:MAG: hypothetical protein JST89_23830 [Cyanobacteria bacterium SZAS-4]|nr:hypothetical protein [Cyanobacteria bacterium SZAS-4]